MFLDYHRGQGLLNAMICATRISMTFWPERNKAKVMHQILKNFS